MMNNMTVLIFEERTNNLILTRLLPEPGVARNNPVSSSRYPFDSATNLSLHKKSQRHKSSMLQVRVKDDFAN